MNFLQELKNIVDQHKINITEKELLDLLQNTKRWPLFYPWGQPTIEIINNLGRTSTDFYENINPSGPAYLDYEKWHKYYELGYTTIVSNIFDLTDDLRKLDKSLKKFIGCSVNANFYFSKPGQVPSFKHHSHPYPVVVKQIYGNSNWKLNEREFILKQNESLIIPAETMHGVTYKPDKKLSLTINLE